KKNVLIIFGFVTFIILGCSSGGGGSSDSGDSNGTIPSQFYSVSLKSVSSKITGYELEVHCVDAFPDIDEITVDTSEVSINGRESSVLGPLLDSQKQNFKVAVMSTGSEDGASVITRAVKFSGCSEAQVVSSIAVDSLADKIEDIEVSVNIAE
ncbi:MAG: hypothetical protein U9Q66_04050, partial [Patescibacteria group bacterium]|nr:hypothetical protein [Patescibacteria group bacterium]